MPAMCELRPVSGLPLSLDSWSRRNSFRRFLNALKACLSLSGERAEAGSSAALLIVSTPVEGLCILISARPMLGHSGAMGLVYPAVICPESGEQEIPGRHKTRAGR